MYYLEREVIKRLSFDPNPTSYTRNKVTCDGDLAHGLRTQLSVILIK